MYYLFVFYLFVYKKIFLENIYIFINHLYFCIIL